MSKLVLRWSKVWLVTTLLTISACSETSFVYNRLNLLLPWYVDDYAELNQAQKAYLDELLVPFLTWHRTQELPNYVKILESIENSLRQPLAPTAVAAIFAEFESAWFRLEGEALNWQLDLGTRLSDEQISGFIKVLWERQHDYEKEYLGRTDQEFSQESYDNLLDSVEEYLGSLSDQQRELLRDASRRLLRSDRVWLQGRADWLTQLEVLLQRQPGWQERVRAAVAARNKNVSPEYLRIYEHNLGVLYDTIAKLLNGRSDQQDSHLRHRLSDLHKELEHLIVQGQPTAKAPPG
jgi:hypothetical protein